MRILRAIGFTLLGAVIPAIVVYGLYRYVKWVGDPDKAFIGIVLGIVGSAISALVLALMNYMGHRIWDWLDLGYRYENYKLVRDAKKISLAASKKQDGQLSETHARSGQVSLGGCTLNPGHPCTHADHLD